MNAIIERHAKAAARAAVKSAVSIGALARPEACSDCGTRGDVDAHHPSYAPDRWLDVVWLCRRCHAAAHARMAENRDAVGDVLREVRHRLGFTQQRAADVVGVTRPSWALWESGHYRPTHRKLAAIAAKLGLTDDEVVRLGRACAMPRPHAHDRLTTDRR